jgi:asparagine synthetase B (glutamine-hydrolysing)
LTTTLGEPLDEMAARWREALVETVRPYAEAGLPLLLSGGVDSGSIHAACLELGHKPKCYAYTLDGGRGGELSQDFVVARRAAISGSCPWKGVFISRSPAVLEEDVREVIRLLRVSRKTSVQCAHPLLYLLRAVRKDGYDRVIAGTGGVVLDGRSVMVLRAEEGEEAARELRRAKLADRSNLETATGQMHRLAEKMGMTLEEPFSEEPLAEVGLAIDLAEMNRGPRGFGQKGIAVRAYPEYWFRPGRYRGATPLQVGGGVREWHDELLSSPLNPMRAKAVVAVYNRLLEELDAPNLLDLANP